MFGKSSKDIVSRSIQKNFDEDEQVAVQGFGFDQGHGGAYYASFP